MLNSESFDTITRSDKKVYQSESFDNNFYKDIDYNIFQAVEMNKDDDMGFPFPIMWMRMCRIKLSRSSSPIPASSIKWFEEKWVFSIALHKEYIMLLMRLEDSGV